MSSCLKVLMLGAECTPFAKTGGLADVLGSLPAALRGRDLDVRVMLPKYYSIPAQYRDRILYREFTYCSVGWRWQYVGLGESIYQGVPCYFIDNEYYFGRQGPYGYDDDAERFAYFCRAALDILPHMDFQPDIIHCHDWHTGMVIALLREQYADQPFYRDIRSVFTIHNLAYQGSFSPVILSDLFGLGNEYFTYDKLEFHGRVSFLKAGVAYADKVTTVSPSYAQEIQTPEYGERMDNLLRYRSDDLHGILNGIDTKYYDPETDPAISAPYSAADLVGKAVNKQRLQVEMGLPVQCDMPMVAIVSRLTNQKGIDLITQVIPQMIAEDVQWVILGTGDSYYETLLKDLAQQHPDKLALRLEFNEDLAHRIYAGSDMFLMPSRFEPCGLAQMIAMRYGTLPIVRETGGLRDTVRSYDEFTGTGNGFSFAPYQANDLMFTLRRALGFYKDQSTWQMLVRQAMNEDWSWDRAAQEYEQLYLKLF
jgi:starch synthase